MIGTTNYEDFKNTLYKSLSNKMIQLSKDSLYRSRLPNDIQYIKSESFTVDYGHPIDWELVGKTGVYGFIIGILTKESNVSDDMTENNYYPPIVTQTLASISPEYSYSQIAIVLVIGDLNSQLENWLQDWKDDNRYFRRILIEIPENRDIDDISENIFSTCFTPWRSIKLINKSDATVENDLTVQVFEEEE